jgi:hypothetical protein
MQHQPKEKVKWLLNWVALSVVISFRIVIPIGATNAGALTNTSHEVPQCYAYHTYVVLTHTDCSARTLWYAIEPELRSDNQSLMLRAITAAMGPALESNASALTTLRHVRVTPSCALRGVLTYLDDAVQAKVDVSSGITLLHVTLVDLPAAANDAVQDLGDTRTLLDEMSIRSPVARAILQVSQSYTLDDDAYTALTGIASCQR